MAKKAKEPEIDCVVTYGDVAEALPALEVLGGDMAAHFDLDTQDTLVRLLDVVSKHERNRKKIVQQLQKAHAKIGEDGRPQEAFEIVVEDGRAKKVSLPNSVAFRDVTAYRDVIRKLGNRRVNCGGLRLTREGVRGFDPPEGYDGPRPVPALLARLGPFYHDPDSSTPTVEEVDASAVIADLEGDPERGVA